MIVFAPKDGNELYDILYTSIRKKLFISIRYPKTFTDLDRKPNNIKIGTWEVLNKGVNICILATGSMVEIAFNVIGKIKNLLNIDVSLINCRFIKPIDNIMLDSLVDNHQHFITLEEGVLSGGFGSAVSEYFSDNNIKKHLKLFGINDMFIQHGTRDELLKDLHLDEESITLYIKKIIENNE